MELLINFSKSISSIVISNINHLSKPNQIYHSNNFPSAQKLFSKNMTIFSSTKNLHVAFFPFMAKGHTIPLIHLAKLVHKHRPHATFTIFTTPANEPFISTSLASLPPGSYTIVVLPFPAAKTAGSEKGGAEDRDSDNHGLSLLPAGVESTDQLPSMSLFHPFVFGLESLKPLFETTLENIQKGNNPITFIICDWFLYWTHDGCSKLNIPRLYFNGMNIYALTMSYVVFVNKIFDGVEDMDEAVHVPGFDGIQLTKNDFDSFSGPDSSKEAHEFLIKVSYACSTSNGNVVNSFEEMELDFLKYLKSNFHPNTWCVGPLCLVEKTNVNGSNYNDQTPLWKWLARRKIEEKQVLYVAFGSQVEITNEQLEEMAIGLENSEVDFLWALRIKPAQEKIMEGFEERVKDRGMVVREWVEQRAILGHESVQGFLSHCGWNSVIESISGSVPILAWPLNYDQHLNARMLVEEIKVGLRVETCDGSVRGFVKSDGLSKMVKELMGGELGKEVRKNVKEYSSVAKKAIEEGGSSWASLDALLNEFEMGGSKSA